MKANAGFIFRPKLPELSGKTLRLKLARAPQAFRLFMKKKIRRDPPSETTRRSSEACLTPERWAFSHTSERLFALGSTESARRFAYRTMMGELRFLPL